MSDEQPAVVPDPLADNPMRQIVHQQETVIAVMRDRILELELELVNARCAMLNHVH